MSEKPNPLALKRPTRTIRELTLTDSSQPGLEIKMRLRALDALDINNATALATDLANKYLYGDLPFPAIDGEVPKLNMDILQGVCAMHVAQCGNEEDKFTPEEIIALAVTCPEIWVSLVNTMGDLALNSTWGKASGIIQVPAGLS